MCHYVECDWDNHVRLTDGLIRRFMKREDARAAKKLARSALKGPR